MMSDEMVRRIADTHIRAKNPDNWDGRAGESRNFDPYPASYPLDRDTDIMIKFIHDEDGWGHEVSIRNRRTGTMLSRCTGYGIDSPQNLADSILDAIRDIPK